MSSPWIATDDAARIRALQAYAILDTPAEGVFDDIAAMAAEVCHASGALICFVDQQRCFIKARASFDFDGPSYQSRFCDPQLHTQPLVVEDCKSDTRFSDDPLVTGPASIRFFASAPLLAPGGQWIGMLAVTDHQPRRLSQDQLRNLQSLATQIIARLELRRAERALRESEDRFRAFMDNSPTVAFIKDEQGRYIYLNRRHAEVFQKPREQCIGQNDTFFWPAEVVERLRCVDRQVIESGVPSCLVESLPHPDGKRDWMVVKFPVPDSHGRTMLGGIAIDITEQMQVEQEIREAERFARNTLDALGARLAIVDERGVILSANRAWKQFALSHLPSVDGFRIGGNHLAFCDSMPKEGAPDAREVAEGIRLVLSGQRNEYAQECEWRCGEESSWYLIRVTKFVGEGPRRVVITHEDITARKRAEEQLRHESLHDALTGLPNRVLLADRIDRCISRAQRDPDFRFALLFMDLDRFKLINDSLGHSAGDEVLREISNRLQRSLRGTDSVARLAHEINLASAEAAPGALARLGGDEFTILLQDLQTVGDPVRVAERILNQISDPIQCDGHELQVTASIGIVICGGSESNCPATSARELLRDADTAMYRAKGMGRGRYVIFDTTLHAAAMARLKLESDLRRAIERDELLLYFQPIVSLDTRKIEGFEALVRWKLNGQLVSPGDFIPVAEDTDLILPIGEWVMEEACRQLADWRRRMPEHPVWVAINVSRRQLCSPDLVQHLKRVLKETGVPPAMLKLEITESVMMADGETAALTMNALKATGVRLAMDDFGTGYSSLSCLHKFPIDVLKIDRSFIEELQKRRDTAAVIQAIVHLAHNLGMTVVAEGLEQLDQVAFLQTLDCDLGQGFVFAKPLSADAAEQFLLNSTRRAMSA